MTARKKSLLTEYKASGLPVATTRSFAGHELKRGEPLKRRPRRSSVTLFGK